MSEHEPINNHSAPDETGAPEQRLQALLTAAYPASEPSDTLRQRIAGLAAQHEMRSAPRFPARRVARRWIPWRIAMGLAAAAVLVLLCTTLAPTITAAQILRRAEAAIRDVRSAHMIHWGVAPDGSRVKDGET